MKRRTRKLEKSLSVNFRCEILESAIYEAFPEVLDLLLKDRTTGRNILWCTKDYEARGEGFGENDEIRAELISKRDDKVIMPRACKSAEERQRRIREKEEVFTPAWICNAQNNLVDNAWFGRKCAGFNREVKCGWKTIVKPIKFAKRGRPWQDYVTENRLEITCGEAPYLASRYDMAANVVADDVIPVSDRIGLLDRKLRVVTENCNTTKEWVKWAEKALQSVYGFDWQGDNVVLARENLLWTVLETADEMMGIKRFSEKQILRFANIISWNIWQMDGLKFVVPNTCHDVHDGEAMPGFEQKMKPCEGCAKGDVSRHNGVRCRVMDWEVGKPVLFVPPFDFKPIDEKE